MGTQLILMSAPSKFNSYYKDRFIDIIKFQISYAKIISTKHNVIILADRDTLPYLVGGHPGLIAESVPREWTLEADLQDIWIRDFGTVSQTKPVKLGFGPQYMGKRTSKDIQKSFLDFLKRSGVEIVEKKVISDEAEKEYNNPLSVNYYPELNIDGGNIVDDFSNNAILCDRFLEENKHLKDRETAKKILQNALRYENVVIITQYDNPKNDTCGHADGLLSFIDKDTVAYGQIENSKQELLISELKSGLGENVKLVELPSFYVDEKDFDNFNSACGLHINSLVTKDCIYMPTFGHDPESQAKGYSTENDNEVFEIMRSNTSKEVVKVPVPYKVCILGGSVRCLTMQLEGPIADHLISLATTQL